MVQLGEFLKNWSFRSNSVTRQVSFNRTNIDGKCQNAKIQMRHFRWFSNNVLLGRSGLSSEESAWLLLMRLLLSFIIFHQRSVKRFLAGEMDGSAKRSDDDGATTADGSSSLNDGLKCISSMCFFSFRDQSMTCVPNREYCQQKTKKCSLSTMAEILCMFSFGVTHPDDPFFDCWAVFKR